jgi:hypothetical protein
MARSFISGLAWVVIPRERVKDGLRLSVWVSPRLEGAESRPAAESEAEKVLRQLFENWPRNLWTAGRGEDAFKVTFRDAKGAISHEVSAEFRGTDPVSDGHDWTKAWRRLFVGDGPFKSSRAAADGQLDLVHRVTPLAPDLTPEAFFSSPMARNRALAPASTVSYDAAALLAGLKQSERGILAELFGEAPSHGAKSRTLPGLGFPETWRTVSGRRGVASQGPGLRFAQAAADGLAERTNELGGLLANLKAAERGADAQTDVYEELVKTIAAALPQDPASAVVASHNDIMSGQAANEAARRFRNLARIGLYEQATAGGRWTAENVNALFSPALFQVSVDAAMESRDPGAKGKSALAAAVALQQAEHFFARTDHDAEAAVEALSAPRTDWRDHDFLKRLSIVQGYRGLLRPLGLVFDLVVRTPENLPEFGQVEVTPPTSLRPDWVVPMRTSYTLESGPVGRFRATARGTAPNAPKPKRPVFGEALLDHGLVSIGGSGFVLATEDHDQAARRISLSRDTVEDHAVAEVLFATPDDMRGPGTLDLGTEMTPGAAALLGGDERAAFQPAAAAVTAVKPKLSERRLFKFVEARVAALKAAGALPIFPQGYAIAKTFVQVKGKVIPVYVRPILKDGALGGVSLILGDEAYRAARRMWAPHARRSSGFSLLWCDHARYVTGLKQHEAEHEKALATDGWTVLDEEDLVAGFAPEVRVMWQGRGSVPTVYSSWCALCLRNEEYRLIPGQPHLATKVIAPLSSAVFQALDAAPGLREVVKEDMVAPALFSWSGGLISVPPDFDLLRAPEDRGLQKAGDWVRFSAPDGSAPPLHYSLPDALGRWPTYQFRLRARHRGEGYLDEGWSAMSDGGVVTSGRLLRHEPLAPPRVLMSHATAQQVRDRAPRNAPPDSAAAESEETWDQRSPNTMVIREGQPVDVRHLAPHNVPLDFCTRYPVFEGAPSLRAVGSFFEARVNPATGEFPRLGDLGVEGALLPRAEQQGGGPPVFVRGRKEDRIDTPYFIDPAARSMAFEVRDELEPGELIRPDRRRVVLAPLYEGDAPDWPRARMVRLELRPSRNATIGIEWRGGDRVVVVSLPPGRTARLRVSTSPCRSLEDLSAVEQFAHDQEIGATLADPKAYRSWTAAGGNPAISPPEEIVLIHAVARPLVPPVIRALHAHRNTADFRNDARLGFEIAADARSMSEVDLMAYWTDAEDDITRPGPRSPEGSLATDPLCLDEPGMLTLDTDPYTLGDVTPEAPEVARMTSSLRRAHVFPFRDGRRYTVQCEAVGKSRYRSHFNPADRRVFTRASEKRVILEIPSTAPPTVPSPAYLLPTFGWETAYDKGGRPKQFESRRIGGGLRVYLERGMFKSGRGEQVAVLLLHPESWGDLDRPAVEHLVTRWGADPLHGDAGYDFGPRLENFLNGEKLSHVAVPPEVWPTSVPNPTSGNPRKDSFSTAWEPALPEPVRPLDIQDLAEAARPKAKFQMVAYTPQFDPDTGKWWFDILLDSGKSKYFPFIRFALARYQPVSLRGAHISKAIQLDFAQPVPDRALTVSRVPGAKRAMRVVLAGPDRRGPPGGRLENLIPANPVQVIVERRLRWRDTWVEDRSVRITPNSGGPLAKVVLADFLLEFTESTPGQRRIVIVESEKHSAPDYDESPSQRIVYADVLDLANGFF